MTVREQASMSEQRDARPPSPCRFVLLLTALAVGVGASLALALGQGVAERSAWAVQVVAGQGGERQLEVTSPAGGRELLTVSSEVESVGEVMIGERKAVALGPLRRSAGDAIIVVDLEGPRIEKTIWAISPVVSPDLTRAAYQTFMPRFPPQGRIEPSISVAWLDRAGVPERVVFPRSGSREDERKHSPVSPILWADDSSAFYFFDRLSPWGSWEGYEISFVSVDLTSGEPAVSERPLDPMAYAKPGADRTEVRFFVDELRWKDGGTIEAVLYPQSYWLEGVLSIAVVGAAETVEAPRVEAGARPRGACRGTHRATRGTALR